MSTSTVWRRESKLRQKLEALASYKTFIAEKSELFCWALVRKRGGEPEMTRSKFEWPARAGYSARGIVFLLVAALAVFSSFGGGKADTKSALDAVLEQPFGRLWLGLIGLGLLGFVAWRLAQSIANADNHDHSVKSYLIRAALLGSAATYMGLAVYAFQEFLWIWIRWRRRRKGPGSLGHVATVWSIPSWCDWCRARRWWCCYSAERYHAAI